jgi:hypothetical protein
MLYPGDQLNLSSEALDSLGGFLTELLEDLEQQHSGYLRKLEVWRKWYRAIPKTENRAEPFEGASSIVVPIIRYMSDAVSARHINTIFAREEKIWVSRSENEVFREKYAKPISDFMNWAGNGNDYDLLTPTSSWVTEIPPYGDSIMYLSWRKREKFLFAPGQGGRPKPHRVVMSRGPYIEHLPRSQVLWQADRQIQESDIVSRQAFYSWGELSSIARTAKWNIEQVEASKGRTLGASRTRDSREQRLEQQGLSLFGPQAHEPYDIREVWIEWPLLSSRGTPQFDEIYRFGSQKADEPTIPLVVTLCRDSRRVFRVVAKPYYIPGWPFYRGVYKPGDDPTAADGLCRILEHIQRGVTTMTNQAIDAMSLANAIFAVTINPTLATQRLSLNRFLKVENMGDISFPNFAKHFTPDLQFITFLLGIGERLTGVNDPTLGRETRMGGHPSPATSTLAMLNESREPLRLTGRVIRHELSRLGLDIATLYQQFESGEDGKIERAIGPTDATAVKEWLFPTDEPLAGNLELDLRAMSDVFNPEAEFQRAMLVDQLLGNYYSRVIQALSVASNPKAPPPIVEAALKSIDALTKSFAHVLEAADVDEVEGFLMKLNTGAPANAGEIERLRNAATAGLGRLEGAGVQPPVLPLPVGASQLPMGTDGDVGAGGNGPL